MINNCSTETASEQRYESFIFPFPFPWSESPACALVEAGEIRLLAGWSCHRHRLWTDTDFARGRSGWQAHAMSGRRRLASDKPVGGDGDIRHCPGGRRHQYSHHRLEQRHLEHYLGHRNPLQRKRNCKSKTSVSDGGRCRRCKKPGGYSTLRPQPQRTTITSCLAKSPRRSHRSPFFSSESMRIKYEHSHPASTLL